MSDPINVVNVWIESTNGKVPAATPNPRMQAIVDDRHLINSIRDLGNTLHFVMPSLGVKQNADWGIMQNGVLDIAESYNGKHAATLKFVFTDVHERREVDVPVTPQNMQTVTQAFEDASAAVKNMQKISGGAPITQEEVQSTLNASMINALKKTNGVKISYPEF